MPTIKIDNVNYNADTLSNEAKAQLVSLQFCDQELKRLQAQAAAYQTARQAYPKALKEALELPHKAISTNKQRLLLVAQAVTNWLTLLVCPSLPGKQLHQLQT